MYTTHRPRQPVVLWQLDTVIVLADRLHVLAAAHADKPRDFRPTPNTRRLHTTLSPSQKPRSFSKTPVIFVKAPLIGANKH
jgi:hypothetical protein